MESTAFTSMSLNELKSEVKKRGLPVSGTKAELISRLENHREETTEEEDLETKPKKQKVEEEKPKKVFPIFEKKKPEITIKEKPEITIKEGKTEQEDKPAAPSGSVEIDLPEKYKKWIDYIQDDGWKRALLPEFHKPYFKKIVDFLEKEKAAGKQIFPPENEIFSAFNFTPLSSVKLVIIGQDPYHDDGQAHGLCFSVKKGVTPPPSLKNIYKELTSDITGFQTPKHGYLESWARQGVFLLNATLTVEAHKANSHKDIGWLEFTKACIRIINKEKSGVVFILWGGFAQKIAKEAGVDGKKHNLIQAAHPSPLSVTKFWGCKVFSKANQYFTKSNQAPVDWKLPMQI